MPGKTNSPGQSPPCPGRCAGSAMPAGRTFRRRSRRPPRPCGGSPLSMPPSPATVLPRTVAPSPHSTPQHAERWNGPWPGSDSSEASSATAPIPVTSSSPLPAPRLRLGPGGPFPRPPLSAARCETPAPTANTGHSSPACSHGSTHPDRQASSPASTPPSAIAGVVLPDRSRQRISRLPAVQCQYSPDQGRTPASWGLSCFSKRERPPSPSAQDHARPLPLLALSSR